MLDSHPRARPTIRIGFRCSLLLALTAFGVFACDSATDPEQPGPVELRVLYAAFTEEAPEGGLYSSRLDGTDLRLVEGGRAVAGLDVSPDGGRVAYDDYLGFDEGHQVFVLELATGEERRLTSGFQWNTQPVWSPDGTRLAFTAQRAGVFGVSVMNADGSAERRLSGSESAEAPAWSNGGDRIAYSITDPPSQRVVVTDVEGTVRRTIAADWANSLDWSADDEYLLAIGIVDRSGNGGIIRLSSDGSDALSLTPTSTGEHGRARWSPDGREILFPRFDREAGHWRLYVMSADGSGQREIPVPDGFTGAADWLSD